MNTFVQALFLFKSRHGKVLVPSGIRNPKKREDGWYKVIMFTQRNALNSFVGFVRASTKRIKMGSIHSSDQCIQLLRFCTDSGTFGLVGKFFFSRITLYCYSF